LAFSSDERTLAVGTLFGDRSIGLHELTTTGLRAVRFVSSAETITSLAFSADGATLAFANNGHRLGLAAVATGEVTWLAGHESGIESVAWQPSGELLATASDDHTARLWDVARGREVAALRGHTAPVKAIAWSPRGERLATSSNDGTIAVWDPSGRRLATIPATP